MANVIRHMHKALSIVKEETGGKHTRANRRKLMIAEGVSGSVTGGEDPRNVLNSFCEISCRKARVDDRIVDACRYYEFKAESESQKAIRRYCSLVLYFAWCEGDVLLPVNFKMMKAVTPEMRATSPSLVLREMTNYEPNEIEEKKFQATSASLMREKRGARDSGRLRRLHDDLTVDSYQLVGWQDASVTLRRLVEEKKSEGVVAGSPEIIKLHLKRAVRQVEPAQFLVDRIVDAKMYPSLSDEVLRRQAARLARKLALSEQELFADENEEILSLYSLIKTRLKALGKTWNEAGELLEQEVGSLIGNNQSEVRLLNARA